MCVQRETWVPGMPLPGAPLQPWRHPAWVGVCGGLSGGSPGGLSRQSTGWWGRGERRGCYAGTGHLLKWKEKPFVAKRQACVSSHSILQEQKLGHLQPWCLQRYISSVCFLAQCMRAVPFKFLESGSAMTNCLKRLICLTCPVLFRENRNDQERTWGSA